MTDGLVAVTVLKFKDTDERADSSIVDEALTASDGDAVREIPLLKDNPSGTSIVENPLGAEEVATVEETGDMSEDVDEATEDALVTVSLPGRDETGVEDVFGMLNVDEPELLGADKDPAEGET